MKEMKLFGKIASAAVVLSVVALIAGLSLRSAFYGGCVNDESILYIYDTVAYADLRTEIRGRISHKKAFDIYARRINLDKGFRHGRYTLRCGMSVIDIARMIKLGEQTPVRLTMSNARTVNQLAGILASQIEADSLSLLAAMNDSSLRAELGFATDSIMAMFIPNTYEVYWTVKPDALLRRLKREYDAFWQCGREAKLARVGLSKYEVATLASIVYEETKSKDEMPKIASVYINRLRRGIPLQACPTVKFAMGRFDLRRVLHQHLKYDSPYNTYRHRGLPPGPICMPSIAAIDAVLDYEKSDWLYFCARPEFDGRHNFARTLREHNANARRYAEALSQRNIK